MKLNLRAKLIGGYVIILLLIVVVGLVGIHTSNTIKNHLESIVEQDVKATSIYSAVARKPAFIHSNSLLHLLNRSMDDMDRYESEIADWDGEINRGLDSLEDMIKDQPTLDRLAEFRAFWDTYLGVWKEQIFPLCRANRDEEAFALARKSGAGGVAAREVMLKLDKLHDANVAAANLSLECAGQDIRRNRNILLASILLALKLEYLVYLSE